MIENKLYAIPELAEKYAYVTTGNICNAEYERPALRKVLGNVVDLDVLDAACSAGENTKWLLASGARVTAIDASKAMVDIATREIGSRAKIRQADLAEPLDFPDSSFDLIASSLTLHYLQSWDTVLSEFKRVLRPRGRLVFSTHHPYLTVEKATDYHTIRLVTDLWRGFTIEPLEVQFYHRSLEHILNDVISAGFTLSRIIEPGSTQVLSEKDPEMAARLESQPWFLIVDAHL